MNIGAIILIIMFSAVFGFGLVGCLKWVIGRSTGLEKPSFDWTTFWVGSTERSVATALTIWRPESLTWFIGAWVLAKLAANWRTLPNTDETRLGHMLALVGNVLSFAFAIGVGLLAPLVL